MNSEKEIIALKEEQRMALASNAMECLHQNLCDPVFGYGRVCLPDLLLYALGTAAGSDPPNLFD